MVTLTSWKKIPAMTAGASAITLALCNTTANATINFSFESMDVDKPLWGDFLIDSQAENIIPRGGTFLGIYPEAIPQLNVATKDRSFEFKNLHLGAINRLSFGRDFLSFWDDTQEVATFTFENSEQFSSADDLEELLNSLDGTKAKLTSSHYYRFKHQVVFSQAKEKPKEVPEPSSVISLLTIASLSIFAVRKGQR